MLDALGIAGDIIQAAAALAGLLVVFTSNAVSGYSSFQKEHQRAVRAEYRKRAWFGFWGVLLAVTSVLAAVLAKMNSLNGLAIVAAVLLVMALGWSAVCAWYTAREVK